VITDNIQRARFFKDDSNSNKSKYFFETNRTPKPERNIINFKANSELIPKAKKGTSKKLSMGPQEPFIASLKFPERYFSATVIYDTPSTLKLY